MEGLSAYVITVEAIDERAEIAGGLAAMLGGTGLFDEAAIHPAIYWRDRKAIVDFFATYPHHTFRPGALESLSMGELAIALSHIAVWKRLLASEADAAVVFEDDTCVTDAVRFAQVVAHLREDPAIEWTRLHLHDDFRDEIVAAGNGRMLIDDPQPWGFAAYYITRSGATKVLQHCCNIHKPIDWYPPKLIRDGVLAGKTVTEPLVQHLGEERGRPRDPLEASRIPSSIGHCPQVSEVPMIAALLTRLAELDALRRQGKLRG